MNYLNLMIFIFLLSFLMIGAELSKSDVEYGIDRDIYNFTEEKIVMPDINITAGHPIERTKGLINIGRVYKILDSFVQFGLTSAEQGMKMGIEYGYQNPDIPWQQLLKYVVILLVIMIVVMLIKPIGYIIIFLIMFVMMIVDKVKKRRKKKG